jgi:hypothetical protein
MCLRREKGRHLKALKVLKGVGGVVAGLTGRIMHALLNYLYAEVRYVEPELQPPNLRSTFNNVVIRRSPKYSTHETERSILHIDIWGHIGLKSASWQAHEASSQFDTRLSSKVYTKPPWQHGYHCVPSRYRDYYLAGPNVVRIALEV